MYYIIRDFLVTYVINRRLTGINIVVSTKYYPLNFGNDVG